MLSHKYTLLIVCALLCLSTVRSANDFTAKFTMTTNNMISQTGVSGFVRGTMDYSWGMSSMKISIPLPLFVNREHYSFSQDTSKQILFKIGGGCCELEPMEESQPKLFKDTDMTKVADTTPVRDSDDKICTHYKPQNTDSMLRDLWINDNTGLICKANILFPSTEEIRSFEFTDVQPKTYLKSDFQYNVPEQCACLKPLDIVLVMDRSGSVSQSEYLEEQRFLTDFSGQFQYAPESTQLGIVEFSTEATPLPLLNFTVGVSEGNVKTAMDKFSCCGSNKNFDRSKPLTGDRSCCIGWTSISSGILAATEQLLTDTNTNVDLPPTKIIVVLTDGFHNTPHKRPEYQCYSNINGVGCDGLPDASQEMYNCITSSKMAARRKICLDDLQAAVDYAHSKIPDLIFYSVFVGPFVSPEEMNVITNNAEDRQLHVSNFDALKDFTRILTQKICREVTQPCGNCCGFCACGICNPAECIKRPCYNVTQTAGTTCCRETPYECPESPNKCEDNFCNPITDSCKTYHNSSTNPCLGSDYANNPCFTYECVPETGACKSTAKTCEGLAGYDPKNPCQNCRCVTPNPQDVSTWRLEFTEKTCSGTDKCQNYFCDTTTGQCSFSPIDPPEDDDPCHYYCCNPDTGEFALQQLQAPCDVNVINPCESACSCETNDPCFEYDRCDAASGKCLFKPKVCDDKNACTEDKCVDGSCRFDPLNKCVAPNKCQNSTCDPSTGNCVFVDKDCDDSNCCTEDSCNPSTGECINLLVNSTAVCPGENACERWQCNGSMPGNNPAKCCVKVEIGCQDDNNCTIDRCDLNRGCRFDPIDCYAVLTRDGEDNPPFCQTAVCNETVGACVWVKDSCPEFAIPLTVGAIVGIVIGIVAFLALCGGGGAAAYSQLAGVGNASVVQTNPLYQPGGFNGENRLFDPNS